MATIQLIQHPEYNSTLILRSEELSVLTDNFPACLPSLPDLRPVRTIHRKLLPRRPERDASMEQFCTFYVPTSFCDPHPTALVLTPSPSEEGVLPYYHPPVSHLLFAYLSLSPPRLQISIISHPPSARTDSSSKLYRTCLALLDAVHRYGWGAMVNYQKRVLHDRLVLRDVYQDLYLKMRERHKGLVNDWHEVTDPLKHVFEVRASRFLAT
jgi:tRNASer (uridine44-2'-O)-methyltransferase